MVLSQPHPHLAAVTDNVFYSASDALRREKIRGHICVAERAMLQIYSTSEDKPVFQFLLDNGSAVARYNEPRPQRKLHCLLHILGDKRRSIGAVAVERASPMTGRDADSVVLYEDAAKRRVMAFVATLRSLQALQVGKACLRQPAICRALLSVDSEASKHQQAGRLALLILNPKGAVCPCVCRLPWRGYRLCVGT